MTDSNNLVPLRPLDNCWRIEEATAASIIIDAEDYFRFARSAMLKARYRIMLIGWDFDARISLKRSPNPDQAPEKVGDFIYWLVERNPGLEVYLLRWDFGALNIAMRGSTIFAILKWMRHPRIHTKLDSDHPPEASHHQKIVVIDDCFAFCGGIDMTSDRWDTRGHHDNDPGRRQPNGKPYKPWHDATTALAGPVAKALGDHSRDRWIRAGGAPIKAITGHNDCWPEDLPVDFPKSAVGIARTAPKMEGRDAVIEVERLYLDQIANAQRWIYAESQYFASRKIAEAIGRRLDETNGPEIVLINPVKAEGWLQPIAMDSARARLHEVLRHRDRHHRFRIYHPYTAGGEAIYVHAKVLIVDDHSIRVGSSNMNNRSLRLDTECDVTIDTMLSQNASFGPTIGRIRNGLLAEHLGADIGTVDAQLCRTGSLIETIEHLRGPGKTLRPYLEPELSATKTWLADNEVLDPEGPGNEFEGMARGGLFRRLRRKPRSPSKVC